MTKLKEIFYFGHFLIILIKIVTQICKKPVAWGLWLYVNFNHNRARDLSLPNPNPYWQVSPTNFLLESQTSVLLIREVITLLSRFLNSYTSLFDIILLLKVFNVAFWFQFSTICSSETLLWNIHRCVEADSCFFVFSGEKQRGRCQRRCFSCIVFVSFVFLRTEWIRLHMRERDGIRSRTKREKGFVELINS